MIKISLKNISKIINSGLTPLRSNQDYWLNGNIPWVKTEQLGQKYIYDSNEKITKSALDNTSIKLNPENTLSIAMYGEGKTRGSVSILKNRTTTNQACCNLVIDENIADYEYVYYNLKTQYDNLRNLSSGVRKNLNSNDIKNFEIFLPSLSTQKQIAKVLSDLDAKIEVNNKINQELEAMAKMLYGYWFVQFEFPIEAETAAKLGNPSLVGNPYKSSGGKMVYNEEFKREIPEGWKAGVLSDIADITMGQSPSGSSYNEEGVGTVFYQGSTDFGSRFPTVRKYTTEPSRMAKENDILLSVRAPVGTLNQAMEDCCIGRGLAALREKQGSISFLWSQMEYFKQIFDRKNASGTTFGSITKDDLFNLKLCIPNKEVLEKFKKIADPFHNKIIVNSRQNQKLTELRDWLLPMLMNGQITVGDVESELRLVAEPNESYGTLQFDDLQSELNLFAQVACIAYIEEDKTGVVHSKTGFQKTMFHAKTAMKQDCLKHVEFKNHFYGTFSKQIASAVSKNPFLYKEVLYNGTEVYKVKPNKKNELRDWMNQPENKSYTSAIGNLVEIYQDQMISNDIERIECLNTVYKIMQDEQTTDIEVIISKMKQWYINKERTETKYDKFGRILTSQILAFIEKIGWSEDIKLIN